MDTVFDILQALGIGAAVGIRPFLPALLVAALATGDVGIDFDGTDWAFLESPAFLAVLLVLLVLFDVLRRRAGEERLERSVPSLVLGIVTGVLAAMLGAGSVQDHGGPQVVGLVVGAVAAVGTAWVVTGLFSRVRRRLDAGAAGLLPLYRELAAVLAAAASVLFPPLALLVVGAVAWLGVGGRRRDGEKYAGLRILR